MSPGHSGRHQSSPPLRGATLILTRSAGSARTEARQVRALGGTPLLLPGTRIAPPRDRSAARSALATALGAPVCIFASPAAARMAHSMAVARPDRGTQVLAVGAATARALHRAGFRDVCVPSRADSEGLLALPVLSRPPGQVGLVGAPGGREILPRVLAERGARVLHAWVYQRLPARLDRRHHHALAQMKPPAYVLISSLDGLGNLLQQLPAAARARLMSATAIVSSLRLAAAARAAGFIHVEQARSALSQDMLAAVCASHAHRGSGCG